MSFTVTHDWGDSSIGGAVTFFPQPGGLPVQAQILNGVLCSESGTTGVLLPAQLNGIPTSYSAEFSTIMVGTLPGTIPSASFAPYTEGAQVDLSTICTVTPVTGWDPAALSSAVNNFDGTATI